MRVDIASPLTASQGGAHGGTRPQDGIGYCPLPAGTRDFRALVTVDHHGREVGPPEDMILPPAERYSQSQRDQIRGQGDGPHACLGFLMIGYSLMTKLY
jgi:hypothetical protein